ncbi:MAG TPA: phage terminase large subunit [Acidiphilium sp.]
MTQRASLIEPDFQPGRFLDFATTVISENGDRLARHHVALIEALERVADGTIDRLMVQMPPGAAKSTYASVLFPTFWFTRRPKSEVIAACHTASLAEYFGRRVRSTVTECGEVLGFGLDAGSRAAGRLGLTCGGEYFATGVHGPITGRRADLIVIDDPVKTWSEADSKKARDSLYDWYRAELLSRLKPRGRIVLVMTRWHEDDLAGRLSRAGDNWTTLRFPALAEENDPLGRMPGEALWPEAVDEAELARRRVASGERLFMALYQQNPTSDAGRQFDVSRVELVDNAPAVLRTVRAWDLAASVATSGRDPDWTVGLKLGNLADGRLVVLDIVRVRERPADVERLLTGVAARDGAGTVIALAQDPGQAGVAQIDHYKRRLGGFQVVSSPESGAKVTRAMPAAAEVSGGRVVVLRTGWTEAFLNELQAFPNGEKDDQVDALSRAVATIASLGTPGRRIDFSMMGR